LADLDLKRFRPWIILIGPIASNAPINSREKWDHLITKRGYSFAHSDDLNYFYAADEVSGLKERLALPPNVSDDYVRSQEQSNGERIIKLEKELASVRNYTAGLEAGLKDAAIHSARLEKLLTVTRAESSERNTALQAEQAHVKYLLDRVEQLEASSERSFVTRTVEDLFDLLRSTGDQLTGGGFRALAKRVATMSVQGTVRNPRLAAIAHSVLKPIPGATAFLSRLELR